MDKNDLVEKFGLVFEEEGMPRIAGRLLGFLLLNEGPFTLDELSEQLQISKTSASTNTRLLQQHGLLEHISRAGDRRDYYQLAGEYGERMFTMAKQKIQRLHRLLSDAATTLPVHSAGRSRVNNMQHFYEFLITDMDHSFARWQEYQTSGKAGNRTATGRR